VPSFILIHPTIWPQYTNVTNRADRQTGQWSDSNRVNRFTNGRPKTETCAATTTHIKMVRSKQRSTTQHQTFKN